MTQHILDARKLLCPLPVIRAQQKLNTLEPEDSLLIFATDKGVLFDIPAYCRIHGYRVLTILETNKEIQIEIAK